MYFMTIYFSSVSLLKQQNNTTYSLTISTGFYLWSRAPCPGTSHRWETWTAARPRQSASTSSCRAEFSLRWAPRSPGDSRAWIGRECAARTRCFWGRSRSGPVWSAAPRTACTAWRTSWTVWRSGWSRSWPVWLAWWSDGRAPSWTPFWS